MAVPAGDEPEIEGAHRLIRRAALVRDADDVMMEIAPEVKQIIEESETGAQARDEIWTSWEANPEHRHIAHELGIDVAEVARRMSMMELSGDGEDRGNRFMARSLHG